MKTSVDISLYPLHEDYIPAIREFIQRLVACPDVVVVRNDLSTQIFGDYETVMDLIKLEVRRSWETHGKGVFAMKFLMDDLRGLADD